MSKIIKLKATARGGAGKGAARAVRREGRVPGVVYGDKKEPQNISFAYNELQPHVNTGRFMSTLIDLEVDGAVVRAIPRDIQFEPVRDFISHVDFLRLGKNARIHVEVPVHFKNHADSPGIKKGGVLNIVRHEIDLYCPADFIPDEILIDLTGLEIGQSIHIGAVKLPENVTPAVREKDFTIATIAAAAGLKEEEEEQPLLLPPLPKHRLRKFRRPHRRRRLRLLVRHPPPARTPRPLQRPLPRLRPPRRQGRQGRRQEEVTLLFPSPGGWEDLGGCNASSGRARQSRVQICRPTGTISASWRWTKSSAAMASPRGASASRAKRPKARSAASAILALKPQTYMNESGRAVGEAMRFYNLDSGRHRRPA